MQFSRVTGAVVLLALIFGALVSIKVSRAQSAVEEQIVIIGEEVPSAYGAPPGFSRSRFSPTTTAYVLPPGAVYAGIIYEGDAFRHGPPDHLFTEEVEVGLPHRFGVAAETKLERFNGGVGVRTIYLIGRLVLYGCADSPRETTLLVVAYNCGCCGMLVGS